MIFYMFLLGQYLDEEKFGCRYLIGEAAVEPSEAWAPPEEDLTDPDPVVRAHWAPVKEVLGCCWPQLHVGRQKMLSRALEMRGV